jgi:diphthamide biosynthesis protein 2
VIEAASTNRQKVFIAAGRVLSPAATFLKEKRMWQGLGSDLEPAEEGGALVEEGRSGVARGYVVGKEGHRH